MRGRTWAAVLCAGLMLVAAPGAHADVTEATQKDFWSAAAKAATATIYAPSTSTLRKLKLIASAQVYGEPLQLRMVCQGQWNVDASYGDTDDTGDGRSLQIFQATRFCSYDHADYDAPPNRSRVKVAGTTIGIVYHGCWRSGLDAPTEQECPPEKRNYSAYGTLPAAGGKEPNYFQLEAVGLSRAEVKAILRSLSSPG